MAHEDVASLMIGDGNSTDIVISMASWSWKFVFSMCVHISKIRSEDIYFSTLCNDVIDAQNCVTFYIDIM